ncbi:hypothetical protein PR048_001140 [Dryococelus australis]|uniref:Retrotransposon gag domain-containing protein n=1 Tax=Dryococelus australis TaxID=614101 RepID=A0ABQ9IGK4_9NEOP|nr:hypothetical protein PR048_001140 [Dryococelus australis]
MFFFTARLYQYFVVNGIKEAAKGPLFITYIGPRMYSILKSIFVPVNPNTKNFQELLEVLTKHFLPARNITVEQFRFHKRDQQANDSVSQYIVKLKNLAKSCAFGQFLADVLRDHLVCRLKYEVLSVNLHYLVCVIVTTMEQAALQTNLFQSALQDKEIVIPEADHRVTAQQKGSWQCCIK